MPFQYKVSEDKKVRVIIDTDAACEADDPFAIAHALMCQKFDVRAIFAEQFNREGSTRQSYEEILTVLRAMKKEVPVFMGEETKISEKKQGEEVSPAADFLIEEAMRVDEKPLFVLCIGAITNVASAMMKKKEIAKHMTIVWIGGQGHAYSTPEVREFNAGNDVEAINYVLNSGVDFIMKLRRRLYLMTRPINLKKEDRKFGCIHRWIRGLFWKILLRNWKFYMERVSIYNGLIN